MRTGLAEDLSARLSDLGLRVKTGALPDVLEGESQTVTLEHRYGAGVYRMIYSPMMTVSSLRAVRDDLPESPRLLLVGSRITERSADMFRTGGIDFLDSGGNAFIDFQGVHIDVRGRAAERDRVAGPQRGIRGGANLFSPKRAQVIFALLSWEDLLQEPLRVIAHVAGTSLGQVQETLELLEERDFIDDRRCMPPGRRSTLLDQWTAAYPSGLGARLTELELLGDPHVPTESTTELYVGGESAAGVDLRPETLTLYSDGIPRGLIRERRWRRDDENANVFIRRRFWNVPPGRGTKGPGVFGAPPLLVYADLLAAGESRQRAAAEEYRERHDRLRAG